MKARNARTCFNNYLKDYFEDPKLILRRDDISYDETIIIPDPYEEKLLEADIYHVYYGTYDDMHVFIMALVNRNSARLLLESSSDGIYIPEDITSNRILYEHDPSLKYIEPFRLNN